MVVATAGFTPKALQLIEVFDKAIKPPPDLYIDQWSDQYRILPATSSSEPGPWRTDRFPFTREPMRCMSPQEPYREIVLMWGAQVAKTETLINTIGHCGHMAPAPMLYVQKTIEAVEKFSKQRLAPSIEESPELTEKFGEAKSRDGSNTIRIKNFPGGILMMGGANSASSLRSMPIQNLLLDEVDSYESDIEQEGDPVELAVRRTANFPRRKIIYASTPTIKETSRIEPLYERGDQRQYHVPCPYCNHFAVITWALSIKSGHKIIYKNNDPDTVYMECESCKKAIPERYKFQMLENGKWVAKFPGRKIASFHLSALYSPLGFYSWKDAVTDWLKSRGDETKLKGFINTVLAETWTISGKAIDYTGLAARRETYNADVPAGALILTAGVDVQENRIEVEVVGWGPGEENWSIDYQVFLGDIERIEVWAALEEFLLRSWQHESGRRMHIAAVGVDSGFKAKMVYNYCKLREHRRIFPVKGRSGWGLGLINRPKKRLPEHRVFLFLAYVDEIKAKVYGHLRIDRNEDGTTGPGFAHFPMKPQYDPDHFQRLTAERTEPRRVLGRNILSWVLPPGRRNEALDCRCYAIAALNIINPNFDLLKIKSKGLTPTLPPRKVRRQVGGGVS